MLPDEGEGVVAENIVPQPPGVTARSVGIPRLERRLVVPEERQIVHVPEIGPSAQPLGYEVIERVEVDVAEELARQVADAVPRYGLSFSGYSSTKLLQASSSAAAKPAVTSPMLQSRLRLLSPRTSHQHPHEQQERPCSQVTGPSTGSQQPSQNPSRQLKLSLAVQLESGASTQQ